MKLHIVGAILYAVMCAQLAMGADDRWQPLFNGRNLFGWETYMNVPLRTSVLPGAERDSSGNYAKILGVGNDPLKCFSVVEVDGQSAIRISGEGFGTLTTLASYSNYHLRLQFKWGTRKWLPDSENKPRGSGLLYHGHGNHGDADEGKRWLNAQQFQIQEGNCGDYVVVGDAAASITAREVDGKRFVYDPKGAVFDFCARIPNQTKCAKTVLHENKSEWNTLELICVGDAAIHIINGRVVLRLTALRRTVDGGFAPLTSGRLQLQMEGSEIYFREIEIIPVTAVPAIFAVP